MDYVLVHHGIKGQRWGIRRYQNEDGSLTPSGRRRYSSYLTSQYKIQGGEKSNSYKRSKEFDDKITNYREKESHIKSAVKHLVLGSSGRTTYDMARSLGYKRGRSFLKSVFDISAGSVASGFINSVGTSAARKQALKGNYGMVSALTTGSNIAGRAADYAFDRSGRELSLQQRHMRSKYVKGSSKSKKKRR